MKWAHVAVTAFQSIFPKKGFVAGTKVMLHQIKQVSIPASWAQGQYDLNLQCHIVCTTFANSSCYKIEMNKLIYPLCENQLTFMYSLCNTQHIDDVHIHEGACPHFTSLKQVPRCVQTLNEYSNVYLLVKSYLIPNVSNMKH